MKQLVITTAALISLFMPTGFAQLFPKVDKPKSDEMSMLVLQFAYDNDGKMENVLNMNFTGWAPAVKGLDGKIVPFRKYDMGANFTNIYYAENLPAGEYTLIGFYHVYTDYGKLKEFETAQGKQHIPSYEPYVDRPYHVKQLIPLKQAVVVKLEPNKVMTMGSYAVKFKWVGGASGTTDDRWKVIEDQTSITLEDPASETVIRYIKTWATPAWKKWNAKNPVEPL
ncbi:MAG TPA: hypothetical protein ENN49_00800 [Bacteroidales bacterium]|nr:hypothetical protein [Bacteroidales bacterium]